MKKTIKGIESDYYALDIRLMTSPVLENDLKPGEEYTIFSSDDRVNKILLAEIEEGKVIYKSGINTFAGVRIYASQEVMLANTPCHYGGTRTWFICPECSRRTIILYWGVTDHIPDLRSERMACRKCHGLVYASERRDRGMGDLNRAAALYEKAGGKHGEKPKYMRRNTYEQLLSKAKYYEEIWRQAPT